MQRCQIVDSMWIFLCFCLFCLFQITSLKWVWTSFDGHQLRRLCFFVVFWWREGARGARGLDICTTSQWAMSWGKAAAPRGTGMEADGKPELHRRVVLRKKQRKEVTKGWGKDGNKETWGEWSGTAALESFLFFQPGDSASHVCKPVWTAVFKSVCRGRWKSTPKAMWRPDNSGFVPRSARWTEIKQIVPCAQGGASVTACLCLTAN